MDCNECKCKAFYRNGFKEIGSHFNIVEEYY